MIVGSVKEVKAQEYRVGLTPDATRAYVRAGHTVLIEHNAGTGSGFSNELYSQAGASIVSSAKDVWAKSDMIVKVKEPLSSEYDLIRENQILFTYLHLAANRELLTILLEKKCIAVAYETIRDSNGELPLLKPMSEIAGRLSVQVGANCLETQSGGKGVLLSGIPGVPKAKVVIIGAGNVGLNACHIAVGMGASVTVLDVDLAKLARIDTLYGASVQTLYSTASTIKQSVIGADLVIGTVLIPGKSAPKLIKRSYLKEMSAGSVFVDVAIDQGGCSETSRPTTHEDPTYIVDDIVHYCVANIPGAVPRTSTIGLNYATLRYGLAIASKGLLEAVRQTLGLGLGINCYKGKLVSQEVADSFDLPYATIESLYHET